MIGDLDLPAGPAGSLDELPPRLPEQAPAAPLATPKPTIPQVLIAPDGKPYTVPAESVDVAVKNGWKTLDQNEAEQHEHSVAGRLAELEGKGKLGGAGRFNEDFHRFGNEVLMGVPDLAKSYTRTDDENAVEAEAQAAFKQDHKAEVYGPEALGFATSLALSAGVSSAGRAAESLVLKGAEETLARKIAASAVKVGVEGAMYSSPQAAVSVAYGDPHRAAETMLWGVGLGAALGGGGKAVSLGTKAIAGAASEGIGNILSHKQANGVTVLDDVARNILGISDKQAQKLGPQRLARIVERADQEGILSVDPHKRAELVEAMLKDSGVKIGDHLEQLDGLLEQEKFASMGPKPMDVAKEFEAAVVEKNPAITTELHEANYKYWQKLDRTVRAAGDSFEGLQTIRKAIRSEGKAYVAKSVQAEIAKLADVTIKKHLEDAAQRIYESGGLKEKFADYLAQKERYEMASQLSQNVNPFKGTGRASHGAGTIGLGTMGHIGLGIASGHPALAALNFAREHAMKSFLANKWGLFGKSVSFLRGVAQDPATAPFIGGFMAKEGAAALTARIETLPEILTGARKVIGHTAADVVSDLVGPTTGLSKEQQYDKLTATINSAQVNSNATAERVGHIASTFTGTNVQLASLVAEKKLGAIAYLQSQIPKDPTPPRAFQHAEWKPSPQQQREFLTKATIAASPMTVWQHYQEGRLTKLERDTMMAVYPVIYQEQCAKLLSIAHGPKAPKLSASQIAQIDMYTGGALGTNRNLTDIQQALQQPAGGQQPQGAGGAQPSSRPRLKAPGLGTDTQRRTSGGAVQ